MEASTSEVRPMLDAPMWFDEAAIQEMRRQPAEIQADAYDKRVRELEGSEKRTFVERGLIFIEMQERELFRYLPDPETGETFTSADRWLQVAAPTSRSSYYAAKRAVEQLRDYVPRKELEAMPRANIEVLKELPPKARGQKQWHKAARELSENELRAKVEKELPEAHIESVKAIRVLPEKSGARVIEKAIAARMELYGDKSRAEAMEKLASGFLDADCDLEEYEGLTNGEAYRKLRKKAASGD